MPMARFLLLIIFGTLGQVDVSLLRQSCLALILIAVLISSVALLSSIKSAGRKKNTSTVTIILLIFFLGPFLIQALVVMCFGAYQIDKLDKVTGKFYTIELPILTLVSLVALYFSCWSIIGILRKFTREDEPLFSRAGAYLFMVGYEFVLFGLFYEHLAGGAWTTSYSYWVISLLPVLAIPFGSLRSFERYLEHSGLLIRRFAANTNMVSRLFLYSNLSLDLGLFAIWAVVSVVTTLIAGPDLLPNLYLVLVLFSFYLFLILLLELYVVYLPVSNKIGLLLVFIAAVYMILPMILSGILENEPLFLLSPVGFLCGMFQKPQDQIAVHHSIWVINLILCIAPILLVWKRYLHILSARRKM